MMTNIQPNLKVRWVQNDKNDLNMKIKRYLIYIFYIITNLLSLLLRFFPWEYIFFIILRTLTTTLFDSVRPLFPVRISWHLRINNCSENKWHFKFYFLYVFILYNRNKFEVSQLFKTKCSLSVESCLVRSPENRLSLQPGDRFSPFGFGLSTLSHLQACLNKFLI